MLSSDPQQPRVCLKWYEAEAYANWRTQAASDGTVYRLPTEAEWEYAARGPQSLIYPWGNSFDSSRLNYCDKNCSEPWVDMSVDDGCLCFASQYLHEWEKLGECLICPECLAMGK
jgi:formylglycine-generating enzyme required for sulfatase activity